MKILAQFNIEFQDTHSSIHTSVKQNIREVNAVSGSTMPAS